MRGRRRWEWERARVGKLLPLLFLQHTLPRLCCSSRTRFMEGERAMEEELLSTAVHL